MRNNILKWHCCLTHKTLKCIYDDLTGRLGGSAWVCIWERGGIRPLTQSNKCYCIYSLADGLMFLSQRFCSFYFLFVWRWRMRRVRVPPAIVSTRRELSRAGRRNKKKAVQENGGKQPASAHTVIFFFKFSGRRRSEQVGELTDGQSASLRQRTGWDQAFTYSNKWYVNSLLSNCPDSVNP